MFDNKKEKLYNDDNETNKIGCQMFQYNYTSVNIKHPTIIIMLINVIFTINLI